MKAIKTRKLWDDLDCQACIGHRLGDEVDIELTELERLAEIGKATEKAFGYIPKHKHQYNVFSLGELHEESDFSFYSVQDLLNWAWRKWGK